MSVSELIEILEKCDQDHQVFVFDEETSDLIPINIVDDSLSDRVDINVNSGGDI